MTISLIAAIGQNREIGRAGRLIFNLPGDLRFFRDTTIGHPILMGYTTWLSLPGKLPGREHYIATHSPSKLPPDVHPVTNLPDFLKTWQSCPDQLFVIGGASLYQQSLPYARSMYLTAVDASAPDADTFFPPFNPSDWTKTLIKKGQDHDLTYAHYLYTRN